MKTNRIGALGLSAGLALCPLAAQAQDMTMNKMTGSGQHMGHGNDKMAGHGKMMMHGHGPIGVKGRHVMPKGKFMVTYRYGHMSMSDLQMGTTSVTPDQVVTSVPNRFFGMPGQPPTLRVVPSEMKADMHMFGAMYGMNDKVTLMAMLPYIEKEMTAITYAGPTGTTVLGVSKRHSEGVGDVKIGATFGLLTKGAQKLNFNLAVSLPTGSIKEVDQMLTPMGTTPIRRLGYPMQLGSGTIDLIPALTYQSIQGPLNWGAQVRGTIRMGSNTEGYSLGDEAAVTAWASYQTTPWLSLSGRVEARTLGSIDGIDPNIAGPAPGANPDYMGGDIVTLFAGADLTPKNGALRGHKIGVELGLPVYQKTNGPKLTTDWTLALAWRKAF